MIKGPGVGRRKGLECCRATRHEPSVWCGAALRRLPAMDVPRRGTRCLAAPFIGTHGPHLSLLNGL